MRSPHYLTYSTFPSTVCNISFCDSEIGDGDSTTNYSEIGDGHRVTNYKEIEWPKK